MSTVVLDTNVLINMGMQMRARRLAAGLSLSDVARTLHYTKGYLSKIENGHVVPSDELVNRFFSYVEPFDAPRRNVAAPALPGLDTDVTRADVAPVVRYGVASTFDRVPTPSLSKLSRACAEDLKQACNSSASSFDEIQLAMGRLDEQKVKPEGRASRLRLDAVELDVVSVDEFIDLLRLVLDRSGLTCGQIAAKTGRPRSSTYNLVAKNRSGLPTVPDHLEEFLLACGVGNAQTQAVMQRWRWLRDGHGISPAGMDVALPAETSCIGSPAGPAADTSPGEARPERHPSSAKEISASEKGKTRRLARWHTWAAVAGFILAAVFILAGSPAAMNVVMMTVFAYDFVFRRGPRLPIRRPRQRRVRRTDRLRGQSRRTDNTIPTTGQANPLL